jgi:hypothetical protein
LVRNQFAPGAIITVLGGGLIVLGSCLPWFTGMVYGNHATAFTEYGVERGAGILTLLLGVLTILIGVSHLTAIRLPALMQRSAVGVGVITGIVVIYDYLRFTRFWGLLGNPGIYFIEFTIEIGSGFWMVMGGAILAIVGGVLIRVVSRS